MHVHKLSWHPMLWISCCRALRLREPLERWLRAQPVDFEHPIEIVHWEYMEALLPVLALFKSTSKYLEADDYPTGSKVLKKLYRLRKSLGQMHEEEVNAATGTAIKPLLHDLLYKFDDIVNDPTMLWQWAFLALMDPTGGIARVCVCVCVCRDVHYKVTRHFNPTFSPLPALSREPRDKHTKTSTRIELFVFIRPFPVSE